MARPIKLTVDYFSHDANAHSGKTLFILQNKFGNDGYAFWFKLLEILANTDGHYYCIQKPDSWEFLLAITRVNNDTARQILDTLVSLEAIDSELYEHKVIWCEKFIERLNDVYSRRENKPNKPVIVNNNVVFASNYPVNSNKNTQTKVKETKVNDIRGKKHESNRGNTKRTRTKLPPRDSYTQPPPDPELEQLAAAELARQ